ncbi:MAG: lycopene cyclase domain-containing protein [Actinomadura sp.]
MDHLQYLLVLAGCGALTLPLELSGSRVYRQPRRLARVVLPVAAVFMMWDVIAIAAGVWSYNPRYVTGVTLPLSLPVEEALFFLIVPVCALLTFETVRRLSPGRCGTGPAGGHGPATVGRGAGEWRDAS